MTSLPITTNPTDAERANAQMSAIDYACDHADDGIAWLRSWREGDPTTMADLKVWMDDNPTMAKSTSICRPIDGAQNGSYHWLFSSHPDPSFIVAEWLEPCRSYPDGYWQLTGDVDDYTPDSLSQQGWRYFAPAIPPQFAATLPDPMDPKL